MVSLLAFDTVVCDHGCLGMLTPMPRVAPVMTQDTMFGLWNGSDE